MLWVTATWGACFLAIRWGLRDAPVLWFATLRALVAGVALFGYAAVRHHPLTLPRRVWPTVAALTVTNVTLAFAFMFAGVAGLTTGTAAVLANAQPLLIVLPAWWLYRETVNASTVIALGVGFAGLLVVAIPGGGGEGAALSLGAAVAITAGTLLARHLAGTDIVVVTAWHFLAGGVLLAGWAAAAAEGAPAISWTPRFALALAFLALVGTAAAFVAWFTETQRASLTQLAAWTFLVPVVGIALAAIVLGEQPAGWTAAGVILVLFSLWFVLRPRPGQANPHR
jgi:drug/metabolite transporter (DMT)-like permease